MRRWVLSVVGIVLALVGVLWTLQGSGVIIGSGMSGQKLWFLVGLIVAALGIVLVVLGVRRPAS